VPLLQRASPDFWLRVTDRHSHSQFLEFGNIGKPHGLRGELVVHAHSDDFSVFERTDTLWIGSTEGLAVPYKIENIKLSGGLVVVQLDDIQTRPAAEKLVRQTIWMERSLYDEEGWFLADLVGVEVCIEPDNQAVGHVLSFAENAGQTMIEVKLKEGLALVPWIDPFVVGVQERDGKPFLLLKEDAPLVV
jgi:16S rRNA processing protein RimM